MKEPKEILTGPLRIQLSLGGCLTPFNLRRPFAPTRVIHAPLAGLRQRPGGVEHHPFASGRRLSLLENPAGLVTVAELPGHRGTRRRGENGGLGIRLRTEVLHFAGSLFQQVACAVRNAPRNLVVEQAEQIDVLQFHDALDGSVRFSEVSPFAKLAPENGGYVGPCDTGDDSGEAEMAARVHS